jgi:DNA-binding transcriptional ArsR family regulator
MKCKSFDLFFETIANKTRMKIINALFKKQLNVSEICKETNEEQSKISHNLKILRDCRIINVETRGKQRIYSLNKETMIPLMQLVEKHVSKYCGKACLRIK